MLKLKFKKAAKLTAMALTFGVVASAAFQGTNFLFNQMDGDSQEEQEAKLNVADAVNASSDASAEGESGAVSGSGEEKPVEHSPAKTAENPADRPSEPSPSPHILP